MVYRVSKALVLLFGLSGCAYDGGFTDAYVASGYGWHPAAPHNGPLLNNKRGFGGYRWHPSAPCTATAPPLDAYTVMAVPFTAGPAYYYPRYFPPYPASGYLFFSHPYGFLDPDDRLKRDRKRQKKELKRERKIQKKRLPRNGNCKRNH